MFRYVLAVVPILAIPTLTGVDAALTRTIAQGNDGAVHPALAMKMRWGSLGALAAGILAAYYYTQGDQGLALLFLITATCIPFMDPFNLFVAYFTGKQAFALRTYYGALARIIPTIVLVSVVFFTKSIYVLVGAYFLSYTLTRYVGLRAALRTTRSTKSGHGEALSLGKHLSFMNILNTVSASLDSILIFHFGGAAALAGYYLATVPEAQISSAFANLNTLALPKFALQDATTLRSTLPRKALHTYYVIIPILAVYFITAPWFFSVFYPKYTDYVFLSDLFMLRMAFFPTGFFTTAFTALNERTKLYISTITYSSSRIILLLIFTPLYGLWGAVAAILAASVIVSIVKTCLFFTLETPVRAAA